MPNLPYGEDYYTQPSLTEIASKEKDEPGSCTRVEGFVFGRTGFGSIRFFGQTNVRNLDLGSIVQFNKREVIVYGDNNKKPPVGQGLNKPAEVTLLKIKCTSKKTGKEYVDGPQVKSYREMLVKMAREQGAEFVSYDPVEGEWKFRVQSF
ncbi:nuclear pore complex protein Nup98-Nup96 [Striga asiatica]|nr:nuclear pore complex protein Nup98-Nup96 [Striga asiatica]